MCVVGGVFAGFVCLVYVFFVFVCMWVRVNVCVMEQMVFRPLCAIEKSPYVFAGLTKCKHTMLH